MSSEIKILVLEDNPNDADLLIRELKTSGLRFFSEIVKTREEFENAFQNFNPDIILSDYSLPAFDGASAFQIKQKINPHIPFIIVSGIIGDENAVKLIKDGVTDYASKNKLFTLSQKISRALKESEERKEKLINAEKLNLQTAELYIAHKELVLQNQENEKQAVKLISANKELLSFTYIASHDLQEPLRKIQIFAGKILDKEVHNLSENGKDMFHRMQHSAERMQFLIEDLLAFSRLTSTEKEFENTDLNRIVEEVKKDLIEDINSKQAIIENTELCDANIIPFQFRQLMQNLISNALKFSIPDKPPHIIIKSSKIKNNGENTIKLQPSEEYCHITVTDHGIGFESEYNEIIFEVFQRLHSREDYAGTGIGLAIVKKIVENHNGIITATSELGKGTRFDIYIPAF